MILWLIGDLCSHKYSFACETVGLSHRIRPECTLEILYDTIFVKHFKALVTDALQHTKCVTKIRAIDQAYMC